jgi:hypothetical protein
MLFRRLLMLVSGIASEIIPLKTDSAGILPQPTVKMKQKEQIKIARDHILNALGEFVGHFALQRIINSLIQLTFFAKKMYRKIESQSP